MLWFRTFLTEFGYDEILMVTKNSLILFYLIKSNTIQIDKNIVLKICLRMAKKTLSLEYAKAGSFSNLFCPNPAKCVWLRLSFHVKLRAFSKSPN